MQHFKEIGPFQLEENNIDNNNNNNNNICYQISYWLLKTLRAPPMFSEFEIERIEILNEYVCVSKAHSF